MTDEHYRSLSKDEDWSFAIDMCRKLNLFYTVTDRVILLKLGLKVSKLMQHVIISLFGAE